jgi:hypothetical protein
MEEITEKAITQMPRIGDQAPDFSLKISSKLEHSIHHFGYLSYIK